MMMPKNFRQHGGSSRDYKQNQQRCRNRKHPEAEDANFYYFARSLKIAPSSYWHDYNSTVIFTTFLPKRARVARLLIYKILLSWICMTYMQMGVNHYSITQSIKFACYFALHGKSLHFQKHVSNIKLNAYFYIFQAYWWQEHINEWWWINLP